MMKSPTYFAKVVIKISPIVDGLSHHLQHDSDTYYKLIAYTSTAGQSF
ncbi:hypothetical protein NIES22_16380 [Calothrix brevissima NIES-22]|nr:hypothetical protein NIES22_16380 [Calothrix brevissima NIES-22]